MAQRPRDMPLKSQMIIKTGTRPTMTHATTGARLLSANRSWAWEEPALERGSAHIPRESISADLTIGGIRSGAVDFEDGVCLQTATGRCFYFRYLHSSTYVSEHEFCQVWKWVAGASRHWTENVRPRWT